MRAPDEVDVAGAVRAAAGDVDIADDVLAEIGVEATWSLADAIRFEAGTVDVAAAVLRTIGSADLDFGADLVAAIRSEGGEVDVVATVDRALRPAAPPVVVTAPTASMPANSHRFYPALALLAAAALVVVLGVSRGFGTDAPEPMLFASAGEITIEDLSYSDDVMVQVIQGDGDAPLILWIDEEATL